jgi:hypothetical protein
MPFPEYKSDVYYKIIREIDNPRKLAVVHMQDHDEFDYDQARFLSDFKYPTEEAAKQVIAGIKIYLAELHLGI